MKKYLLMVLLLLIPVLSSCKEEVKEVPELLEPVGVVVDTETVVRGTITDTQSVGGYITPKSKTIYFNSEGRISNVSSYSGKWVEEGEILIELSTEGIDEQIEELQDEVSYLQTEIDYERSIGSYDVQMLTIEASELEQNEELHDAYLAKMLEIQRVTLAVKQSTEKMEREIQDKNNEISKLEETREENVIRASKAGHVVLSSGISKGKTVHKDEVAAFIIDPEDTCFRTNYYLSEQSYKRFSVTLLMDGKTYDVQLIPRSPEDVAAMYVSGKEMTSDFEVVLPENEEMPEAGTYGVLLIDTKKQEDTLIVNAMAVSHDGAGDYVYVIEDNKRVRRDIITGITNGIMTEVISGLQEGETVYVQN